MTTARVDDGVFNVNDNDGASSSPKSPQLLRRRPNHLALHDNRPDLIPTPTAPAVELQTSNCTA